MRAFTFVQLEQLPSSGLERRLHGEGRFDSEGCNLDGNPGASEEKYVSRNSIWLRSGSCLSLAQGQLDVLTSTEVLEEAFVAFLFYMSSAIKLG